MQSEGEGEGVIIGQLLSEGGRLSEENEQLREQVKRLRSMLRKVEWKWTGNFQYCLYCHAMLSEGHKPDCEWVREMGAHAKSNQATQTETPTTTGSSA